MHRALFTHKAYSKEKGWGLCPPPEISTYTYDMKLKLGAVIKKQTIHDVITLVMQLVSNLQTRKYFQTNHLKKMITSSINFICQVWQVYVLAPSHKKIEGVAKTKLETCELKKLC